MKLRRILLSTMALSILVLTMLISSGCESTSDSEVSTNLGISASADSTSISVGTTIAVEALVTNNGEALTNRVVTFAVSPIIGSFNKSTDTSDATGYVEAMFTATQSGTAIVTFSVSGTSISTSVAIIITGGGGGYTGSGNIEVVAVPTSILANGVDSSTVTITVRSGTGDPAPDSTEIILVAGESFTDVDGNGQFTNNVDSILYDVNNNGEWDGAGYIVSKAYVTGGAGVATAVYKSGTVATTVYIRATVTATGYDGYTEAVVYLTPDAEVFSITMFSDSTHLAVKGTGGLEVTTLHATGYDYNGNTVPEGLPINFMIMDGPDPSTNGERLGNLTGAGRRGPYTAVTNSMGVASCPISSGQISGTIRIRCYADTVISQATQIMVHAGPPAFIVVGAKDCNVPYWDNINETNDLVALVYDVYNNPCTDSTVVYFTCDEGVVMAHQEPVEAEDGLASSIWMSWGAGVAGSDGDVWVTVETEGGTVVGSSMFLNTHSPDTFWYEAFPSTLPADNKTKGFMRVQIRDLNFNLVDDLSEVKLIGDYVKFVERANCAGCYCSSIDAYIVAEVLDQDYSLTGTVDDGIGAKVLISSHYKGFSGVTDTLNILTGFTYSKNSDVDIPASVAPGDQVPIVVTIKDRSGNPLGDHTVQITTTNGSIINGTQTTNTYGEAAGCTFVAGAAGTAIITIDDTDPRGGVTFTKTVKIEE